jgi:lysophospholipase L1-like esterase
MKKIIFILFLSLFIISCAKQPLDISLTAENTTIYIQSSDSFSCQASGGEEKYTYSWKLNNKPADCSGNSCNIHFDKLGKYEIICEVFDGKERVNQSVTIEVIKIPKRIECIYGFGDSLTEAYGVSKEDSWISFYSKNFEDVHLFNYAVSDSTSYNVSEQQIPMLWVQDYACFEGDSLIFLWFGANDIKRFVPLEDFRNNYIKTIESVSKIKKSKVVLITIPDVSKLSVADEVEQNVNDFLSNFGVQIAVKQITQDIISEYNQIIFDLAKEYNLYVIDMFFYMENFDNDLVSSDRFHPNEKGHKEISKTISKEVENIFKDYDFY